MKLTRHIEQIGDMRNAYKVFIENLKGQGQWEDPDASGRTILKCILKRYGVWMRNVFIWDRTAISGTHL
jgi:hypothetical protein